MKSTCQLHKYDEEGNCRDCGAMAVVIWKSRDGNLLVCEQCEAMIEGVKPGVAWFEPLSPP